MNTRRMVLLFGGVFLVIVVLVVIGLAISSDKDDPAISQDQPETIAEIDVSGYTIAVAELQDARDGWIVIDALESQSEGWLVIYNDNDGALGDVMGAIEFEPGYSSEISIPIIPDMATPIMYAVLHSDGGKLGIFERDLDAIITINDQAIAVDFKVTLAGAISDIFIDDQSLLNGSEIEVMEVAAPDAPVWLVIYADKGGEPDQIIGFAWVEEEAIEYMTVSLEPEKITDTLYAGLHLDLGNTGVFEPDGEDRLIYLYEGQQFRSFKALQP